MATSFVHVPAGSDFPLENLPYGIFSTKSNVSYLQSIKINNFHMKQISHVRLMNSFFFIIFGWYNKKKRILLI